MTLEEKIANLTAKVDALADALVVRGNQKIRWKETETETGIKLQENTTVFREGILLSVNVIPTGPGAVTLLAVAKRDDGAVAIINGPFEFVK